jgi:hypothetical protein
VAQQGGRVLPTVLSGTEVWQHGASAFELLSAAELPQQDLPEALAETAKNTNKPNTATITKPAPTIKMVLSISASISRANIKCYGFINQVVQLVAFSMCELRLQPPAD